MPRTQTVDSDVSTVTLTAEDGSVRLGKLGGVHAVVLMRHRH